MRSLRILPLLAPLASYAEIGSTVAFQQLAPSSSSFVTSSNRRLDRRHRDHRRELNNDTPSPRRGSLETMVRGRIIVVRGAASTTDDDDDDDRETTTTTTTSRKGDNKAMSFLRKMGRVGGAANMDFATAMGLDESPSGGTKSAHHEGGFKVRAIFRLPRPSYPDEIHPLCC